VNESERELLTCGGHEGAEDDFKPLVFVGQNL